MKSEPLVTIFTITRNRDELLYRAIKSILHQTYKNIEYIIIDSASNDNTEAVVNSFNDERIKYVKLYENRTFGYCVNMAVDMAHGVYVTELDDDDEYHLDKIEKQVALFRTLPNDYGMVYCWMTYYDNDTKKILHLHKAEERGFVLDNVVEKATVSGTPTLLFRRDIFDKVGRYKEEEEIGIESDWEFAARICSFYKVDYVPESLVNVYENHGHLRMTDRGYYKDDAIKRIKFHNLFLKEFVDIYKKNPSKAKLHYAGLIRNYILTGDYKNGFYYYRKLILLSPGLKNIARFPYYLLYKIYYDTKY